MYDYTEAARRRTSSALTGLESFLVQHRLLVIIGYAYVSIINMILTDWQVKSSGPEWPIYNGAQLLDPSIIEPLDRRSVLQKASSQGQLVQSHQGATGSIRRAPRKVRLPREQTGPVETASHMPSSNSPTVTRMRRPLLTRAVVQANVDDTAANEKKRNNGVNDQVIVGMCAGMVGAYVLLRWSASFRSQLRKDSSSIDIGDDTSEAQSASAVDVTPVVQHGIADEALPRETACDSKTVELLQRRLPTESHE
jgi:hypothetical protein